MYTPVALHAGKGCLHLHEEQLGVKIPTVVVTRLTWTGAALVAPCPSVQREGQQLAGSPRNSLARETSAHLFCSAAC